MKLYNHVSPKLSENEYKMVLHIPPGGNWKDIPETIPSQRLAQIRKTGGRTTYYGRLRYERPSYTISTYFNRIGNGCFVHPEQNRLISIREAARLQSFPDKFVFFGSNTSKYKQVGNAVPPLLARAIAKQLTPYSKNKTFVDLFAGAGGMSKGFDMEGFELVGAIELEKNFFETFLKNHSKKAKKTLILGDITKRENKEKIVKIRMNKRVGVVIGGPPCQGFSTAGWRNPKDKRNRLYLEFVDVVDKIEPEFFVMENVPGILTMQGGDAIKEIVTSFERIGYTVSEPIKLNAEEFGVPQLRRRVFIIGSRKKIKVQKPKPLFSSDSPKLPKPITVREAIGSLPQLSAGEGDFVCEFEPMRMSEYEKFISGKISFTKFYDDVKKNL